MFLSSCEQDGVFKRYQLDTEKEICLDILFLSSGVIEIRAIRSGMDCGMDLTHEVEVMLDGQKLKDADMLAAVAYEAYLEKVEQCKGFADKEELLWEL